jgi:hypothetical protein
MGFQFIDRQVQAILPREKRMTLANGSVIPILEDSDPRPVAGRPTPKKELLPLTKVRVAKMIVLPPSSDCVVPVQCAAPGLRFLQSRWRDIATGIHMANGVAEILPNQPFTVRVVNTSTKTRRLPKGMVLGHAIPHPTAILARIEDPDVSEDPTGGDDEHAKEELSPMYNELQSEPPPLPDRPDVDGHTWKDAVQLSHLLTADLAEILGMLDKHRSMWNGRLGRVHSTAHRIDIIPG